MTTRAATTSSERASFSLLYRLIPMPETATRTGPKQDSSFPSGTLADATGAETTSPSDPNLVDPNTSQGVEPPPNTEPGEDEK